MGSIVGIWRSGVSGVVGIWVCKKMQKKCKKMQKKLHMSKKSSNFAACFGIVRHITNK